MRGALTKSARSAVKSAAGRMGDELPNAFVSDPRTARRFVMEPYIQIAENYHVRMRYVVESTTLINPYKNLYRKIKKELRGRR